MTSGINRGVFIRGAAENNLREIDVDLPHRRLVAISGVSGSGKSSLVFDTLYAEARRRFLAALDTARPGASPPRLRRPRVARIDGLAPALATDQGRCGGSNPRSTAATAAGIHDYVRALYAQVGKPHCLGCGSPVHSHRFEELLETASALPAGTRLVVLAPLPFRLRQGEEDPLQAVEAMGYTRLRLRGETPALEEVDPHELAAAIVSGEAVDIVVDRMVVKPETMERLRGSLEAAVEAGEGRVGLLEPGTEPRRFSVRPSCSDCGRPFKAVTASLFSFNSAHGACGECRGLGARRGSGPDLLLGPEPVNGTLSPLWDEFGHDDLRAEVVRFCERREVDPEEPARTWPTGILERFWSGERGRGRFRGVGAWLDRLAAKAEGEELAWIEELTADTVCAACAGRRLNPDALAVEVDGIDIGSFLAFTVDEAGEFARAASFEGVDGMAAAPLLEQISGRAAVLGDLGLGYLALDRPADTLSSGEFQRLRLAGGLGSGLTQVLYLIDEPSAGLHARDAGRLGRALRRLTEAGNTAVFVEHDPALIRQADFAVDLGPGAGSQGGEVVAAGTPEELAAAGSPTGRYLASGFRWPSTRPRRKPGEASGLRIEGASGNNLKGISIDFPLGLFLCVTGVSGSGKSSLVQHTLYPALAARLQNARQRPLPHASISGSEHLERVIAVDQRPLGRGSRSNAATCTGILTELRGLFARTREARVRGYRPSHFSFNAAEGACASCRGSGLAAGDGLLLGGMPNPCPGCGGRRYNPEVLQVRYRGLSIADVLDLTVAESLNQFKAVPGLERRLRLLAELGLGYLPLRQSASQLSGGEAQRVKLASELSRPQRQRTLYILDEPTTGLHLDDVGFLVELLQRLVDRGNTVLVVEHCIELIAAADWVIDIGPEAGAGGGELVAAGTPEQVGAAEGSWTGRFLRTHLEAHETDGDGK